MIKTLLITLVAILPMSVKASSIIKFNAPELIDLFDTSKTSTPTSDTYSLPVPPVKIVKTSGTRFAFKLDQKTYWVEAVDVETSNRKTIESLCNSTQLAIEYEVNHYGIRGSGVGCKK